MEYVMYSHSSKVGRLKTLEAELERIRRVKERLAKKEAKLLVEILRIREELAR